MTVQDLIAILEGFEPTSEVKLAVQPNYPFQHSIEDCVEVIPNADGLRWGVHIIMAAANDEEFSESDRNTLMSATDLYHDLTYPADRMKDNGIAAVHIAAMYKGEIIDSEEAETLSLEMPPVVYIADGGQEKYLPEDAAETLDWNRS